MRPARGGTIISASDRARVRQDFDALAAESIQYIQDPAIVEQSAEKSGRRAAVAEAPAASPAVVSVNWGVLPPAVTLRESVFCVAGSMDPARKARLAARRGGVTLRPGGGA